MRITTKTINGIAISIIISGRAQPLPFDDVSDDGSGAAEQVATEVTGAMGVAEGLGV